MRKRNDNLLVCHTFWFLSSLALARTEGWEDGGEEEGEDDEVLFHVGLRL